MKKNFALKIWILTVMIVVIGLVALYSASCHNIRVPQRIFYNQLIFALGGLLGMHFLSKIDYRRFFDLAYIFYILTLLFLVGVLFVGRDILGARRWVTILGMNFQPSEFMKLSLILALARYISKRRVNLSFSFLTKTELVFRDFLVPLILTIVPMFFIFKQPDLGTSLLLLGIFFVMVSASGISYKILGTFLGLCCLCVPVGWHFLKPYQKDRLLVFLNPNIDPLGAGYTIIQSKIAVGSGQIWGKGWLSGTQNQLNFLPERHTDFIFSVIGEEWGFLGALFLVFLFFLLIQTALDIAGWTKDRFGFQVAIGIAAILTLQVIINIGMVIGLFPIVGLTLPFVSYGRSSFLIFLVMMGFLLNLGKKRTIF